MECKNILFASTCPARHLVDVVISSKDEANMSLFQIYVGKAAVFYVVRMALATISAYAETQLVR